jgi:hypothetical protein
MLIDASECLHNTKSLYTGLRRFLHRSNYIDFRNVYRLPMLDDEAYCNFSNNQTSLMLSTYNNVQCLIKGLFMNKYL